MTKKLKILFLIPRFPTISETFIVNQIIDLIDRGHMVHIFATEETKIDPHPKIVEYNLLENVFYTKFPVNVLSRLMSFFAIFFKAKANQIIGLLKTLNFFKYGLSSLKLSQFYKVAWLIDTKNDYDIVHAHFGPMSLYFFDGQYAGFFKNAKLITTFHGYDIIPKKVNFNKVLYKELIQKNITVTANTVYTKSLLSKIGCKDENIHVLPVGIDTEYYRVDENSKKSNEKIVILFCGRIIKFKGVSRIAEMANLLIKKHKIDTISFRIIGHSGESDKKELNLLLEKIKKYNLESYFELLGSQNQREVINHMSMTDIYIMPGITNIDGRAENQGLVIQEAQSMKVPVIVTDAGGMKYGLQNKITGFVVNENDLDGFIEKIKLLAQNPKLRAEMGEKGRKFVRENYDSKILGNQLERIYLTA